ncbi:glutathione binding-like protein [Corticibacterium sp. UT-5YL-CI-8]|nr:glutathione binding-like protein [Tianweitania sp. UT-5YL-CI-8]
MELYFSPLACSTASRISIYEAGAEGETKLCQVDTRTKRIIADDSDYLAINPLGQVPALRTADGRILIENAAILSYLADRFPEARLGVPDTQRYELARWLSFVGAELHKQVFTPLLSHAAGDGARDFARASAASRLAVLDRHLCDREYLLDHFSVADAYLIVVLNWAQFVQIDLGPYPAVAAYVGRISARPSVARALREELALFHAARR